MPLGHEGAYRAREAAEDGLVLEAGCAVPGGGVCVGGRVAVVPGISGPVPFLGGNTDWDLRCLHPGFVDDAALLWVDIGLRGSTSGVIAALGFSVAGCAVFLIADSVAALFVARSLQGIATGLASGAIGAALIDLQPAGGQRASLVTSAFSILGLALGALISSALIEYALAPTHLISWALLGVFVAGIVAVLAVAESGVQAAGRPGLLAAQGRRAAPGKGNLRQSHSGVYCALGAGWPVLVIGACPGR